MYLNIWQLVVICQGFANHLFNMKTRFHYLNSNFIIADFISKLNVGLLRKLRFIRIAKTKIIIRLLRILYKQGVIRAFRIENNFISVYFKFRSGQPIGKFKLVSRPGKRVYWGLKKLLKNFNVSNFSGFYILSNQYGLVTSNYCLLSARSGGEVIMKIEI